MNTTKFSVAISAYKNDDAAQLERALESITRLQSVKPAEIVLVVDGPIGEELDRVIRFHEEHEDIYKVVRLEQNAGLGNALRVALDHASYELVARMDSDDVSVETRFEQQLAIFEKDPSVDVVGGDISEFIGKEDNIVAYRCVPKTSKEIRNYLRTRCPLNHVSVMMKKSSIQKVGGYLDLFWNEDYFLWIRMALAGSVFANTGTVLVNVRTGADMYQRRGGRRYFESERFLQRYMLEHQMIGKGTYIANLVKRWIVQCVLPNNLRGWVFRTFARKGK